MNLGSAAANTFIWGSSNSASPIINDPNVFLIFPVGVSGKVGINRIPAANALEVGGDASKDVSGVWGMNSDRRIKRDVENLKDPLEMIGRLRPVRYRYTDAYREKHKAIRDIAYYNFIAQEFQEVFPDSVKDSGEDGFLQIDIHNVIPTVVAAIQELERRNQVLLTALQELNKQIHALEEHIRGRIRGRS